MIMYDDDDGCGGCLGLLIFAAIFVWISEHWIPIVAVIAIIIAIPLIIAGVRRYKEKSAEREAKEKAEAHARARAEDEARWRREREAFDRYFSVQEYC